MCRHLAADLDRTPGAWIGPLTPGVRTADLPGSQSAPLPTPVSTQQRVRCTRDAEQGHTHPVRADGSGGVIDTARQRATGQVASVGTGNAVVARTGQFEILVRGALQAVEAVVCSGSGGPARSRSHVVPIRSGADDAGRRLR